MFRFAPYVLKTLWRHRIRTFLTMSGAAVALYVFSMVGAIQQGLDDLKNQGDRTLVVFQANKFCPATSKLQQDYERTIAKISGVNRVLPIQVFTNNCRASLDVIVFYGVPAKRLRQFRKFDLVAGNWSSFENDQYTAIVGQDVARRRGIEVGKPFSIGDVRVKVVGIFTAPDKAEENYIYTHLDFLQRRGRKSQVGSVTQFEVQLNQSAQAESICTAIDDAFRGGPTATDTRTKGVFQASSLADLFELIELAQYLGFACIGVMIVLVSTTSLMSVQDRIHEHAILQTIGYSPRLVFSLVLSESLLLSVLGGALGVGAAIAHLAFFPLSIGAEAVAVTFTPSLSAAAIGLALAVTIGIVSGLAPALQAARAEIVAGLRHI